MQIQTLDVVPVPAPRMTRRDKFMRPPRPAVARYFAFAEKVRAYQLTVPAAGAHVIFTMPMPSSWPQKKREKWNGEAHQQKPDFDNLLKALIDAIHYKKDDSHIWDVRVTKIWGESGSVQIIQK